MTKALGLYTHTHTDNSNSINTKEKIKFIILIIVVAIVCSCTSVFAYNYLAKNINYKKKDGTIINVEEALNELYKEKNTFEHYAQIPSGTTINVNKGDYIIAISVNPITATNSETIVENFLCTRANGVGVCSQVFKATDTTMTLTVVDGWSFAYYVIKR